MAEFENIRTEVRGRVAIIRLDRPKALNALNDQLMDELGQALLAFIADVLGVAKSRVSLKSGQTSRVDFRLKRVKAVRVRADRGRAVETGVPMGA